MNQANEEVKEAVPVPTGKAPTKAEIEKKLADTQVLLDEAVEQLAKKNEPSVWKPTEEHFDVQIHNFLKNQLMPFHSYLSEKNMSKKYMSPVLDLVIDKLTKINSKLGQRERDRLKEGVFGED